MIAEDISKNVLIEEYCVLNTLKKELETNPKNQTIFDFSFMDTGAYLDEDNNNFYYSRPDNSDIGKTLAKFQQDKGFLRITKTGEFGPSGLSGGGGNWQVEIKDKESFLQYYKLVRRALERKETKNSNDNFIVDDDITKLKAENAKLKEQIKDSKINPKKRSTLNKMIIAVAVEKFGYKPSSNDGATTKFKDFIEKLGMPVSADGNPIRDALEEAYTEFKDEVDNYLKNHKN